MILIDANLLIYAINQDAVHHTSARRWLEQTLSSTQAVGLAWIVLLAFLRITTHPKIMARPLSSEQALAYVDSWLQQPFVYPVAPGNKHWLILRDLLHTAGTAGNLTSDAHLAALALEYGYAVYSADNDFKRFAGLQHINPLTEIHNQGL